MPIKSALHERLLVHVTGLSFCCPFTKGNPLGCPLHDLRKKPQKERVDCISMLSEEALFKIYELHCECLHKNERVACKREILEHFPKIVFDL